MSDLSRFPLVTDKNIYGVMRKLGIRPFKKLWKKPVPLHEYLGRNLDETQWDDYRRRCPQTELMMYKKPGVGVISGFRVLKESRAVTFALLPADITLIVGEWKYGSEEMNLCPPTGKLYRLDRGSMARCAKREYEEETGVPLTRVVSLSGPKGILANPRFSNQAYFPFLGFVKTPIRPKEQKLGPRERLRVVRIRLEHWLTLIESGKVIDDSAVTTTYLALRKMGRLEFHIPKTF